MIGIGIGIGVPGPMNFASGQLVEPPWLPHPDSDARRATMTVAEVAP